MAGSHFVTYLSGLRGSSLDINIQVKFYYFNAGQTNKLRIAFISKVLTLEGEHKHAYGIACIIMKILIHS